MIRPLALALTLVLSGQAVVADELGEQVRALYRPYEKGGDDTPAATDLIRPMASKRLRALLDRDTACSRKNGVCNLDFDVIVNGQDFKITHVQVSSANPQGDKAAVLARFDNFDGKFETRYEFVRESGAWRLDDVEARAPAANRWRLSTILSPKRGPR